MRKGIVRVLLSVGLGLILFSFLVPGASAGAGQKVNLESFNQDKYMMRHGNWAIFQSPKGQGFIMWVGFSTIGGRHFRLHVRKLNTQIWEKPINLWCYKAAGRGSAGTNVQVFPLWGKATVAAKSRFRDCSNRWLRPYMRDGYMIVARGYSKGRPRW